MGQVSSIRTVDPVQSDPAQAQGTGLQQLARYNALDGLRDGGVFGMVKDIMDIAVRALPPDGPPGARPEHPRGFFCTQCADQGSSVPFPQGRGSGGRAGSVRAQTRRVLAHLSCQSFAGALSGCVLAACCCSLCPLAHTAAGPLPAAPSGVFLRTQGKVGNDCASMVVGNSNLWEVLSLNPNVSPSEEARGVQVVTSQDEAASGLARPL